MGIRVTCPNCNKQLNVKSFLAGKRGVCPECRTKFEIPSGTEHNVVLEVEDSIPPMGPRHADGPFAAAPAFAQAASPATLAPQVAPGAPYAGPVPPAALAIPGVVPTLSGMPGAVPVAPPSIAPLAAAPADPIAQWPHAAWHICTAGGEKFGPVMGAVLRQWINERRLAADSLVWRDGWDQWQRADQVFTELSAVPPIAAMAVPIAPGAAPTMFPAPAMFPLAESPAPAEMFPAEPPRRAISRSYGRRSNNNMRTVVLVLLVLAVLILAPLLGYVLMRQF